MDDNSKLQALAEKATPGPWAVDDDTYVMCGRGPIFDTEYSGPEDSTRVETYEAADAAFIAAANPATVLALLAEINRLRTAEGDAMTYKAGMENVAQQRDQLKAENERLERNRDMWKAKVERQAEELTALRKDGERLVFCTSHPEQQFFQGESGWGVMDCADGLSIPFKNADSLRSAIDRVMTGEPDTAK